MLSSSRFINDTPVNRLNQQQAGGSPDLLVISSSTNRLVVSTEDINQQIKNIPNSIISLQYSPNEFLTFRVSQANQGEIVRSGIQVIGLRCKVNGKTYTFNSEHFNQMSNRERTDLFNYLKINESQIFQN